MKAYILQLALASILSANFAVAQDTAGTTINQQKFEKISKKKKAVILDVRTSAEYKEGYIPKAVNYNVMDSIAFVKSVEPLDKKKKYLLYCKSGRRSAKALVMMKQMGFKHVYNLSGGITGWNGEKAIPQ